jgi:hypothetical protein
MAAASQARLPVNVRVFRTRVTILNFACNTLEVPTFVRCGDMKLRTQSVIE